MTTTSSRKTTSSVVVEKASLYEHAVRSMPHLKAISGLEVYNAYKQFFDAYPGINNHGIRTYTEQELALILKSSTVPDTELFSLSYWKGRHLYAYTSQSIRTVIQNRRGRVARKGQL